MSGLWMPGAGRWWPRHRSRPRAWAGLPRQRSRPRRTRQVSAQEAISRRRSSRRKPRGSERMRVGNAAAKHGGTTVKKILGFAMVAALAACGGSKQPEMSNQVLHANGPDWVNRGTGAFGGDKGKIFYGVGIARSEERRVGKE